MKIRRTYLTKYQRASREKPLRQAEDGVRRGRACADRAPGLRKRSPYKKRSSLVGAALARTGVDCTNIAWTST